MGKTSILGVLRLRAVNPLLGDRSARRFAQDDGLVGVLKNILVGCTKTREIKKSQPLRMTALWRRLRTSGWVCKNAERSKKSQALSVAKQRLKSIIHVLLNVAVEQGEAWLVGDEIHYGAAVIRNYDRV